MKKQIVSTLLALCMLLCLMPTAAFAEGSTETRFSFAGFFRRRTWRFRLILITA